jgi:hypothetical protein
MLNAESGMSFISIHHSALKKTLSLQKKDETKATHP